MVNIGIIGAGNIAHRFTEALKKIDKARLYGISGRNEEKLKAFANQYNVEHVFVGHEKLLACKEVDAVYIALPHHLHKEWILKALYAGKAVMVEKPAVMSVAEMLEVKDAVDKTGLLFMEGQKARFVPLYREFKRRLDSGEFGDVVVVEASLCNDMSTEELIQKNTYHYQKGVGGALLDCGTYCASVIADLLDGEISSVKSKAKFQHEVDVYVHCEFSVDGKRAVLETAFDRAKKRVANIITTKGMIELEEVHRPTKMTIKMDGKPQEIVEIPYDYNDFYSQVYHFVELLEQGKRQSDIVSLDDSLKIMEILEFIKNDFKNILT